MRHGEQLIVEVEDGRWRRKNQVSVSSIDYQCKVPSIDYQVCFLGRYYY